MFDYAKMKKKRFKDRDAVRAIDAQRKAHIAAQNAPKTSAPAPDEAIQIGVAAAMRHTPDNEFTLATAAPHPVTEAAIMAAAVLRGDAPAEVPTNWRDLNWPQTRDLATKIAGREPNSRAEARALIAAHATGG